jgi:hypothetical protein
MIEVPTAKVHPPVTGDLSGDVEIPVSLIHFFFLFSSLYIDIIQANLEHSSKIRRKLCQEILTKLCIFCECFGMIVATGKNHTKKVWHDICYGDSL